MTILTAATSNITGMVDVSKYVGNTSTSGLTMVTGSMVSNTTFGPNLNDGGVEDVLIDFTTGRSNFTPNMFRTSKFTSSVTEVTTPNSSFTGNVKGTLTSIYECSKI
nr:hypothetical protein [Tanacetum cinerariifolium]